MRSGLKGLNSCCSHGSKCEGTGVAHRHVTGQWPPPFWGVIEHRNVVGDNGIFVFLVINREIISSSLSE